MQVESTSCCEWIIFTSIPDINSTKTEIHYSAATMDSFPETNNQGVNYFERGDLPKAFQCYRQALQQLFKASSHDESSVPQEQRQTHKRLLPLPLRALDCYTCYEASSTPATSLSPTSFALHSQCFRLMNRVSFSMNPLDNDDISSSIVIFNTALVFHLQALKVNSIQHLTKAMTLYQQAATLLREYIYAGNATGNALVDVLYMAILNNLGLLYRDFSQHGESRDTFHLLIRYALSIQSTAVYAAEKGDPVDRQIYSFLLNATILGLNSPDTAAAA
jgi:tetratricopeptide (TPR) repeat protein